jgi:hypothetical protein
MTLPDWIQHLRDRHTPAPESVPASSVPSWSVEPDLDPGLAVPAWMAAWDAFAREVRG